MTKLTSNKAAGLGLALIALPFYFVSAAVLKYALGIGLFFDPLAAFFSDPERLRYLNTLSPVVFLGGLLLALALNIWAILRVHIQREDHAIISTLTLKPALGNLTVIAASSVLLVTLLAYAFLENFTPR
jgi:hypothetical protein